jgi:UDP-glucose 4-epimerase
MTKCVIFGGNGFIGSHLADGLIANGYEVSIFDTFSHGKKNISHISKIETIKGDFLKENDLNKAMKNADYVFHYISTTNPATSAKNPIFDVETNVIGSIKLFQSAQKNDVEKIFFSSSGGTIYGEPTEIPINELSATNPVNPYAISKLAIEKYLEYFHHQSSMDYVILRYSNPYGERQNPFGNQGVIPIFLNKIRNNENPTIYGDGNSLRDYIYIKDAIDATLAIINVKNKSKIYNIGYGKGTSLNELIKIMSEVTGKKISPDYINDPGLYISKIVLDIQKIQNETGWFPKISIRQGISKMWDWINLLSEKNC